MYLLYSTFILSISHFHIFYKHLPHKIPIHTHHISLNSMPHIAYKIHVQQSIYIQFLYILQTPYLTIYIFLTISTHLKTYQNILPRTHHKSPFSWKTYIYNAKSPSYGRQKLIKIKSPSYGRQYHSCLTKKLKEQYIGKII